MKITSLTVGPYEVNCYLLENENKEAFVIDPGQDAAAICDYIARENLKIVGYVMTHGHADHICALFDVCKKYPAPLYMHPQDLVWAFSIVNQIPPFYPQPKQPDTEVIKLQDKQIIPFGDQELSVLYTPGHSPGSVCLYAEKDQLLISGDTLFKESAGRTDLPGGDSRQLAASLKKLALLPDPTNVYPGHGASSTIGHEKKYNFFLQ